MMNHAILLLVVVSASHLTQAIPTSQDDYEHARAKNQEGYEYEDAVGENLAKEQELEKLLKDVLAKEQGGDYEYARAKEQYDYEDAKEQDDDYPELHKLLKDVLAKEQDDDYPELQELLKDAVAKEQGADNYEYDEAKEQYDYEDAKEQDDDYPESHKVLKDVLAKEQYDYAREQEDDYPEVQYKNYDAKEQEHQQMSMLKDVLQELAKSEADATTQGSHCYYFTRSSARRLYKLLRQAYIYLSRRRG